MKQKHTFHTLAATAIFSLVPAFCGHTQTVQYLAPSSAFQPTGSGRDVLLDPSSDPASPSIFVGSIGWAYGEPTIFRLTPADSSFQQFTSEPVDAAMTTVARLVYNPADGAIYAVGRSPKDPSSRNSPVAWTVRKSQDGGSTWANDGAPFLLDKNNPSWANGITTDAGGNVYVTGVGREARSPHWMIRRKAQGGTWSTVFDVKNPNVNMLPSLCFFPGNATNLTPAVIAASDLNSKWTVMRSQNQGSTWQQVDSWTGGGTEASAYDVICDQQSGILYAVGCRGLNFKNPSAWVVRTSVDGGSSWTTLLDVSGRSSWASRAAIDGSGTVSVSGVINPTAASTPGGTALWMVIRCSDPQNSASWSTAYNNGALPYGDTTWSKGAGIATDASGNIFVTGLADNWTDTSTSPAATYSGSRVGVLRIVPGAW